MKTIESDVCILGGGISGALLAQKLARKLPGAKIALVEAGKRPVDLSGRAHARGRYLHYGENPWAGDFVKGQLVDGGAESHTMAVGGWALHWGGWVPRFSQEDLRLKSLYGLAADWPISWEELEKYYGEAENAIGVCGEPSPYSEDARSAPFPMPPMPLSSELKEIQSWLADGGHPARGVPMAINTVERDGRSRCNRCDTCFVCPTGAKYSPDFTVNQLLIEKKIELHESVLIRKLTLDPSSSRIASAEGVGVDSDAETRFRARFFVLALGKYWSPHLLLLSACSRFPQGLANSSGLVGKYLGPKGRLNARIRIDRRLTPGTHFNNGMESRKYLRCPTDQTYVRYGSVFQSDFIPPRGTDAGGKTLWGQDLLEDWRKRLDRSVVKVRAFYDAHPDRESGIQLDSSRKNRWGDPLPRLVSKHDEATMGRRAATLEHFQRMCGDLAKAGGGEVLSTELIDVPGEDPDSTVWFSGGCRMSENPQEGVCDSFGRTFDHENLYVVGAPTLPTPGTQSETLTYAALTLRSAEAMK